MEMSFLNLVFGKKVQDYTFFFLSHLIVILSLTHEWFGSVLAALASFPANALMFTTRNLKMYCNNFKKMRREMLTLTKSLLSRVKYHPAG